MTIRYGICRGGPLDGKTHAETASRRVDKPGGFYVYVAPRGSNPASWKWIENKEKPK